MIARLVGTLEELEPGQVVMDTGGVGYLVHTPLRTPGEVGTDEAVLWVHTLVREDQITLFGFAQRRELAAFERLIGVAGVGPRTALAVLSSLSPDELATAVAAEDAARLQRVPGIGKKTAQRLVLELKGALEAIGSGDVASPAADLGSDAVSALMNLGYSDRDARRAVEAVRADTPDAALGEILRLALQKLTR